MLGINNKVEKSNKGVALIITIMLMTLLLLLALFFLSFSITEKKIAKSQSWGAKTHYLAEAGINEMVWRLKNNSTYKTNFETNASWTQSFTREDVFGEGSGSYEVTITNSDLAHGEIISIGSIEIGEGKTSQRIVKTAVYRAMGEGGEELEDNSLFSDEDIELTASRVNFNNSSMHSNDDIDINLISIINVDNNINTVDQYDQSVLSAVNYGGDIYAANEITGAADNIDMPAVDFDSTDYNSFKNRADVIYTESEFNTLMKNNRVLTLDDDITYVEGDVELLADQELTINGLLVADGDIIVGRNYISMISWFNWRTGNESIAVTHSSSTPAGLIAKGKVNFELFLDSVDVEGVIYAGSGVNVLSLPSDFNLTGAVIGRDISCISVWSTINVNLDSEILSDTLSTTEFSPVITVEHWEEEY